MAIKVSVVGATGRMGKLALELIEAAHDLELHSALDSKSDASLSDGADVIFEVTRLEVSQQVVAKAIAAGQKIVVGTSGWSAERLAELPASLGESAVVVIPNFSVGSMLATRFAAEAGKFFDSIEIVETHHAGKLDSPSGTAISTAKRMASASNSWAQDPTKHEAIVGARGAKGPGDIPIHAVRMRGVVANQEVVLGTQGQTLTIRHDTIDRASFMPGVVLACKKIAEHKGFTLGLDKFLEI